MSPINSDTTIRCWRAYSCIEIMRYEEWLLGNMKSIKREHSSSIKSSGDNSSSPSRRVYRAIKKDSHPNRDIEIIFDSEDERREALKILSKCIYLHRDVSDTINNDMHL